MNVGACAALGLWPVGFDLITLDAPGPNVFVKTNAGVSCAHLPWHLATAVPS